MEVTNKKDLLPFLNTSIYSVVSVRPFKHPHFHVVFLTLPLCTATSTAILYIALTF